MWTQRFICTCAGFCSVFSLERWAARLLWLSCVALAPSWILVNWIFFFKSEIETPRMSNMPFFILGVFFLRLSEVLDDFQSCLRWFAASPDPWLFGGHDKLLAASFLHTRTTPPPSYCLSFQTFYFPSHLYRTSFLLSSFLPRSYPIVSCLLYCSSSSSSTALSFLALPLLPQSPWRSTMWPSFWGVSPPTSAWAATSLWTGRWLTTSTSAPTTSASSETGSSPAKTP